MARVIEVGLVFMSADYSLMSLSMSRAMFETVRDLSKAFGIILGLAGIVWILQGLDVEFAPQSFMTGDPVWVVLGVVAVLAGGAFLWRGARRK